MLKPGAGSPKSVPGTPALHAPRTNPVGLRGVPEKAQPPAGTSPPGADRPCRLTPKSLYDARQSVPRVQNGGGKSGLVVAITAMTFEAPAGSSTNGLILLRSSAELPAAATTMTPLELARLATRLKALKIAAPCPLGRLRGTKPPSDIETTSTWARVESTMPLRTQEKAPLPPPFRHWVRRSGPVPGTRCKTLTFRMCASGATPITSPVLGPKAP